jgi:hypothetical protein
VPTREQEGSADDPDRRGQDAEGDDHIIWQNGLRFGLLSDDLGQSSPGVVVIPLIPAGILSA